MSRWQPERLAFGLDGEALVAISADGELHTLAERAPDQKSAWDEGALLEALRTYLAPLKGAASLRIAVAPGLCRHWTQEPPAGLRTLAELQQLTARRCAHLFGREAADWTVVADWSLDAPFACSALPAHLLETLAAIGRVLRRQVQVESAVLVALNRLAKHAPRTGWIVWHTPSTLVMARRQGSSIATLRCLRHGVMTDDPARLARLESALQEERLRIGSSEDDEVLLGNVHSGIAAPACRFAALDSALALPSVPMGGGDASWAAGVAHAGARS